ncbi:MAG: hypothetical protein ACRDKL_07770, partial [Solirubrobacteraceae bacterium]
VLAYPRTDPRRAELIAELYAVTRIQRPLWVAEQLEVALFEGLGNRLAQAIRQLTHRHRARAQSDKRGVRRLTLASWAALGGTVTLGMALFMDDGGIPRVTAARPEPMSAAQALIDPPGEARGGGGLFDLTELNNGRLLPHPFRNVLQAGRMSDGVLKTTAAGNSTIGMFAFSMSDQRAAMKAASKIVAIQLDGGLKDDDNRALQGVSLLGNVPVSETAVYRAVYVLYKRVIFVEVFGPNRSAAQTSFYSLINQQVN